MAYSTETEIHADAGVVEVSAGGGDGARSAPRASWKTALWIACGGVLIYLSTWVGAVTFHVTFQRPLVAQAASRRGGLIDRVPEIVAAQPASGWRVEDAAGLRVPVPPGASLAPTERDDLLELSFEGGTAVVQRFPEGFLTVLLAETASKAGGVLESPPRDCEVLDQTSHEHLGRCHFGWSAGERTEYAARILVKMLLWEPVSTGRFEIAYDPDTGRASALAEHEGGSAKLVSAGPGGVIVVLLPADAPAAWRRSPADWLLR